MSAGQEKHLALILSSFSSAASAKYRKGQAEHGGSLYDRTSIQLIDMAVEEAIDQVIYLLTLRHNLTGR